MSPSLPAMRLLQLCLAMALPSLSSAFSASSTSSATSSSARHPAPVDLDWDSFGFSLNDVTTDYMYLDTIKGSISDSAAWSSLESTRPPASEPLIVPYGPLPISPASTVLNYGQGLFEGLKAFRRKDGDIIVFRPDKNAARCMNGCTRMLIPPIPISTFVDAVEGVVAANARFVPPTGTGGALYLRPIVFGSGAMLNVAASDEFTFCIWASPVGNYFKTKKVKEETTTESEEVNDENEMLADVTPITLLASKEYVRSAQGAVGGVKAIGNYSPCFKGQQEAKDAGFDDALFLDADTNEYVEEAGASNFFAFFPTKEGDGRGGTLVTPPLDAYTILAGCTRDSILTLARNELAEMGVTVEERPIKLTDLAECGEAFCCGTGASVTPVGRVVVKESAREKGEAGSEEVYTFGEVGRAGEITNRLYKMLHSIQWGTDKALEKKYSDWILVVKPLEEKEGGESPGKET